MAAAMLAIIEARTGPGLPKSAQGLAALIHDAAPVFGGETTALAVGEYAEAHAAALSGWFDHVVWIQPRGKTVEDLRLAVLAAVEHLAVDLQPRVFATAQTAFGLDVAAAVAAGRELALLSDVQALTPQAGAITFSLRKLGGAVTSQALWQDAEPLVISCLTAAGADASPNRTAPGSIRQLQITVSPSAIETLASAVVEQDQISLEGADIIVSGGKGLNGPEPFTGILADLARELGGAVGASRAVVDAGWVPHAMQIGQTGKSVAPKLYLAFAISGQIQHRVGMQTSGTIVAVNKDPKAPVAGFADLLVVGDALTIVPELTRLLREEKVQT